MACVFELDPGLIDLEKKLSDDLQLDSLDMLDLIIALNDQITGEEIDPTLLKDVKTVQDLVDSLSYLWK